jgi:hypothetical protein
MLTPEQLARLEELLNAERYAGSKDWREGSLVERVDWLIAMYEAKKAEIEDLEATITHIAHQAFIIT